MTALLPCSSTDPHSHCTWVPLALVHTSSRLDTTQALLCYLKVTCLREAWCPSQHNCERPDNSYWFDPLSLQIRRHFERLSLSTLDPTRTLCCHSCQEDCCIDYMSCTSLTMLVLMHEQLYSVKTHQFQLYQGIVLTLFKHAGLWGSNMSGHGMDPLSYWWIYLYFASPSSIVLTHYCSEKLTLYAVLTSSHALLSHCHSFCSDSQHNQF